MDAKDKSLIFQRKKKVARSNWEDFLILAPGKTIVVLGQLVLADGKPTLRSTNIPPNFSHLLR